MKYEKDLHIKMHKHFFLITKSATMNNANFIVYFLFLFSFFYILETKW